MPTSQPSLGYYFELAARIYVACMLSVYGLGKIVGGQFHRFGKLPEELALTPLAEVGGFDLAWTFFGYSFGYILFIGGSQLVGSALLLFERTKLLGVAILLPILANIIVVDHFFTISVGAMSSAIGYTCALGFVLYYNWPTIREAILTLTKAHPATITYEQRKWLRLGLAIAIVVGLVFLENQMLNLVGR